MWDEARCKDMKWGWKNRGDNRQNWKKWEKVRRVKLRKYKISDIQKPTSAQTTWTHNKLKPVCCLRSTSIIVLAVAAGRLHRCVAACSPPAQLTNAVPAIITQRASAVAVAQTGTALCAYKSKAHTLEQSKNVHSPDTTLQNLVTISESGPQIEKKWNGGLGVKSAHW